MASCLAGSPQGVWLPQSHVDEVKLVHIVSCWNNQHLNKRDETGGRRPALFRNIENRKILSNIAKYIFNNILPKT